ncbi:MAG: hypothetical protein AABO58_16445 [Acidobacteriota bacterium]
MRFLRFVILTIVAVPAFAQQSWEGVWSGTTSQGRAVSITVNSSNRISTVSLSGMVTGTGCTATFETTGNFSTGPTVSSAGAFSINAPSSTPGSVGFSMTGTLTIAGTGTGQASFNLNSIPGVPSCAGIGTASLNVTRQGGAPPVPTPTFSTIGVLAVVGSVQGAAFFRTGVQVHNPRSTPISGKFVYHPQGTSGTANDASMTYTLQGGQTIDYADLLPAMGLSGLGSLDIMTTGDPAPIMVARVFSDAGDAGTAGFTIDPLAPSAALQSGDSGVIIVPSDLVKTRLNVGLRSLEAGASMLITLRSKAGVQKGTTSKTMTANFFEQPSVASLLPGLTIEGSDTITFSINSGRAIIYGAATENKTQDPSLQYAKKTF